MAAPPGPGSLTNPLAAPCCTRRHAGAHARVVSHSSEPAHDRSRIATSANGCSAGPGLTHEPACGSLLRTRGRVGLRGGLPRRFWLGRFGLTRAVRAAGRAAGAGLGRRRREVVRRCPDFTVSPQRHPAPAVVAALAPERHAGGLGMHSGREQPASLCAGHTSSPVGSGSLIIHLAATCGAEKSGL